MSFGMCRLRRLESVDNFNLFKHEMHQIISVYLQFTLIASVNIHRIKIRRVRTTASER